MSEKMTSATSTVTADKVPTISMSLSSQRADPALSASGSSSGVFTSGSPGLDPLVSQQAPCKVCGKEIVREKRTICPMCSTAYHPGCAAPIKVLPNGALQRCCGSKVNGRLSPNSSVFLSGDDRSQLLEELKSVVRDEIKHEVLEALKVAIGEELKAELFQGMTVAVGKAFEDVNNKITKEVGELRASVDVLQEARDVSEAQIGGLVCDMGTVSARLETAERSTSARFDGIMGEIASIREMLAARAVNDDHAMGPGGVGSSQQVVDEIEDRLSRRRNVIMFGLPEPVGGDGRVRKAKDLEAVSGIFRELSAADSTPVTCLRLGKFSEHLAQPRPLKVVFSSADIATNLLINASQKKFQRESPGLLGQVHILQDQTENQRLHFKQLKLELAQRKVAEENPNLRILTRNGVPRIVSVPPRVNRGTRGGGVPHPQ